MTKPRVAADLVPSEEPRDAKIIALILKSMGVEDYEPRVIPQFLEFAYRTSSFYRFFDCYLLFFEAMLRMRCKMLWYMRITRDEAIWSSKTFGWLFKQE